MMNMLDQGENDEKIICIHLDDPEYREITHISQLATHRLNELKRFFEDYKKLEKKDVIVEDFLGPEDAKRVIRKSMDLYQKMFSYLTRGNHPR
jgi:inorganic pyrophosphatase